MLKPGTSALAIKYRGELSAALTERTGMGGLPGAESWSEFRYGYGPDGSTVFD